MPNERGKVSDFDFQDNRGWVGVSLDHQTFEKVFNTLQESTDHQDLAEIEVGDVWQLLIYDSSRRPEVRPSSSWNDRLALLGCGIVAFVILSVFIAGVKEILDMVNS
jgi:hypothetical protein